MQLAQSEALRLIHNFGTNDPFRIAELKNICVIFEDLGNIYGYFYKSKRIATIHINNRLDDTWARWTCAHEIGHQVLHPGLNLPFLRKNTLFHIDKYEREAHTLALHLHIGNSLPEPGESKSLFLRRCGVPLEFHTLY
ncbi:ImmA/IrrE family metallo-endopeptidase [Paenibacillus sp. 11B]|uniref:ImmA/IrrE family metallo-endopeptidase n=1 Tax=Paenibacillus sp. 11B TaxID=3060965 RepID=UPI002653A0CF|nr:ImmA/IrrE family metallo-endopeptidase [Paenibacillus sp. 11B]MDN8591921.1 ImmA/IrrE family metallo-endopeptidase [Paenibacillus sp. 11B]